ncbi:MAG: methionine--tRNA ligase subunit beta [Candidatus Pacebacteria bacterium]|nr:methionine--tRNA ligase subunit beta [Candidatus Paceibacterota bacterium]
METINYDYWSKVDLRVVEIKAAEPVEGSEKLLKLTVILENEERQIVSGIAKSYTPESLIGRQVVIIANLEPRSLMGLESQGMLLAADSPDGPVILMPERLVAAGVKIK